MFAYKGCDEGKTLTTTKGSSFSKIAPIKCLIWGECVAAFHTHEEPYAVFNSLCKCLSHHAEQNLLENLPACSVREHTLIIVVKVFSCFDVSPLRQSLLPPLSDWWEQ